MDLSNILMPLLTNPISLGVIVKVFQDFLKGLFLKADKDQLAQQHKGWLEPTLMVLTVITSAISLALQDKLHELDLNSLTIWIQALVTQFVVSKGTGGKTVQELGAKVASVVQKK